MKVFHLVTESRIAGRLIRDRRHCAKLVTQWPPNAVTAAGD
jgi:hypothetical protein